MERETQYWIGVASKDHVQNGIKEGICQLCHGKAAPLKRMKPGDWLIYYSGKEKFGEKEPCQKFTAIGQVKDDNVYEYEMSPDFIPFRRRINFVDSEEASIITLINNLEFIKDKTRWGAPFRFGFLEISKKDFELISEAMGVQK